MANVSTIQERLIFTDLRDNHNKFWHAEVDGETLTLQWGRVGDVGQRKVMRFTSEHDAKHECERRKEGKIKKGYTVQQTLGDSMPTSIGSAAKTQIQHGNDPQTATLIDFLVKRNIHAIEGTTSIRLEHGQLTTPLGPVTSEGLDAAQTLLDKMAATPSVNELDELANDYLRIIPRAIGRRRIEASSLFGDPSQLQAEQATLDSLRAVVKDISQKAESKVPQIFQTRLAIVDPSSQEFKRIQKKFKDGINKNHQSAKLQLKQAWEMTIESSEAVFEAAIGNIKELWHGTKDANLLSILKGGYVIPRRGGSIAISGRMFGDGIYFSDQATKSLNYASGFWGGSGSQRSFMLLNDVAMGKEYIPKGSSPNGCPKGYDSTFAKAGSSSVMNNEMIVYRTSQVKPIRLCEFG